MTGLHSSPVPEPLRRDDAELARKAALFREGTKRIYERQGDRADMWYFELWHFLGDVQSALSQPVSDAQGVPDCGKPVAPWLWACAGCGSQMTIDQIKGEHPNALSCCPERKMAPSPAASPAQSSWRPYPTANAEVSAAVERTMKADYKIGGWLSAALEDPAVCAEMKADINAWFEAHQPGLVMGPSEVSSTNCGSGK